MLRFVNLNDLTDALADMLDCDEHFARGCAMAIVADDERAERLTADLDDYSAGIYENDPEAIEPARIF